MRPLDRRELLKILGPAAGAFYLPSFSPKAEAAPAIPLRFLFFYTFHSSVYDNWIMRRPGLPTNDIWEIDLKTQAQADWGKVYGPLYDFRQRLLILDTLANVANLSQKVPGDTGIDPGPQGHNGGPATILTSSNYSRKGEALQTAGGLTTIRATGPSLDQIIANKIAVPGRLKSLECGPREVGHVYGGIWKDALKPLLPTYDPKRAVQRVFPMGMTPTLSAREKALLAAGNANVALTKERFARVAGRLRGEDRTKLEAHRDLLADLNTQLGAQGAPMSMAAGCPATPPTVVGGNDDAGMPTKQAIDEFGKVITAAFACDITRVASIQIDVVHNAAEFGAPGITDIHNDVGHHAHDPVLIHNNELYYNTQAQYFASLLKQLDAVPEPDGKTLLDHTMVMWVPECGSWEHQTSHIPVVIAGGGGFKMGRYLYWPSSLPGSVVTGDSSVYPRVGPPHSRLLVSIARQFGLDVNQIGNVTSGLGQSCLGPLDRLL